MNLIEAILNRRSIRKYKNDPVSDDLLEKILESARWAPSWANTQCWRFIVVKDKALKEKLRDTLTPWNPGRNAIIDAPVVIVACAELGKSGFRRGEQVTDRKDWYMFDVALALQNLTLTAYSLGLGTLHIGAFDANEAGKIVSVPDNVVAVELVVVGYPDESPEPRERNEIKTFIYKDKYGASYF